MRRLFFIGILVAILSTNVFAATGSISGRVLDDGGQPLQNATVYAKEQFGGWQMVGQDTSDASGNYKIEGLGPGPYSIYARLTGYGTPIQIDVMVNSGQETQNQDLSMSNNPGSIYGTVTDTSQQALDNVRVGICVEFGQRRFWIDAQDYTALSGDYEILDLAPGNNYYVEIQAFTKDDVDYAREAQGSVAVVAGQGTEVDFQLTEAAKIEGVIRDEGGTPIEGVDINIFVNNLNIFGGNDTTGADGIYSVSHIKPGYMYTLEATPPAGSDYVIKRDYINMSLPGTYVHDMTLDDDAITISGKVTEKASGNPLPNIRVTYWNMDYRVWNDTYADENGDYSLTNLPTGEAQVRVESPAGYAGTGVEEEFNEDATVNFALAAESTISGVIKDADTGELITAEMDVAYTSDKHFAYTSVHTSDGTFTLGGLPEGIGHIRIKPEVNPEGEGYAWFEKYFYLSEGQEKTGDEISLKKASLITIEAREAGDPEAPIPFAEFFTASSRGDEQEWYGTTDADGNVRLRLIPGITHRIYFEDEDEPEWVGFPQEFVLSDANDARTIELLGYGVDDISYIRGSVVNPGGHPRHTGSSYQVCAFPAGDVFNSDTFRHVCPVGYAHLDAEGEYSMPLPPDESYLVCLIVDSEDENDLWSMAVRDILFNVTTGSSGSINSGQDLEYDSEGATLLGTVTYNGQPALFASVYVEGPQGSIAGFAETDENGDYQIYNSPAGDYTISAWHADCGASADIAVNNLTDGVTRHANISIGNQPPIIERLFLGWRNRYIIWRGRDPEDRRSIYYSYRIDDGEWSALSSRYFVWVSDISQGLSEGLHTFSVKAIDRDGAVSAIESIQFGNVPPVISYLNQRTHPYLGVIFNWLGTDDNEKERYLKYSYRLDQGTWSNPSRRKNIVITDLARNIRPGSHTFYVKVIDSEGAESDPASSSFEIAQTNTPPQMRSLTNRNNEWIRWQGCDREDARRLLRYSFRIDEGVWSVPRLYNTRIYVSTLSNGLTPGTHTFSIKVVDTKNTESAPMSVDFFVKGTENVPPEITELRKIGTHAIRWDGTDSEDPGRIKFSYKVDDGAWSAQKPRWFRYIRTSDLRWKLRLQSGTHTFYIKVIDPDGAESAPQSIDFTI